MRQSVLVESVSSTQAAPRTLLRSVIACLVGTFLLRMAASVMGNMLQLYFAHIDANEYPLSFTLRSFATAIFFLPELVGSPVLGSWSDRYGRKLFIMIGPLSGAVAVQLTAMTSHFGILAITRLLEGLSTASAIPATLGYLSALSSHDESLRGRIMGLFEIATIGGTMGGILIAGRLWDVFGRSAFTLDSLLYLFSLGVFLAGISEMQAASDVSRPEHRHHIAHEINAARDALTGTWERLRRTLSSGRVLRFVPAWLAINMILGAWFNNVIGQLVESRQRFPDQLLYGIFSASTRAGSQISLYAGAIMALFGLGVLLWSLTFAHFKRTSVMLVGALGLFVLCGFLFALNHAGNPDLPRSERLADPLVPLYLVGSILGLMIVSGFTPAALTYLADVTEDDPADRGAIMGLYSVFFGVGQLFGTLMGGPFADAGGMDGLIFLTLLLGVGCSVTLIQLHRYEGHARAILMKKG